MMFNEIPLSYFSRFKELTYGAVGIILGFVGWDTATGMIGALAGMISVVMVSLRKHRETVSQIEIARERAKIEMKIAADKSASDIREKESFIAALQQDLTRSGEEKTALRKELSDMNVKLNDLRLIVSRFRCHGGPEGGEGFDDEREDI